MLPFGGAIDLQWSASDGSGVNAVDLLLSRNGASCPCESLAVAIPNGGTFSWTVSGPATANAYVAAVAHDTGGNTSMDWSDAPFTIADLTGVGDTRISDFVLDPIRPNPVHGGARIGFAAPRESTIRLSVLDVAGREIALLTHGRVAAGRTTVGWNGRSADGALRAGLYFLRLETPARTIIRRFALIP